MKIFASSANNIINIISKFKNKNLSNKELNINILSSIIFNYYYFKKESKKLELKKQQQNEIFQNFYLERKNK